MANEPVNIGRRTLITGPVVAAAAAITPAQSQPQTPPDAETKLADIPLSPTTTITAQRRDDIVLIGLNRPFIQNRLDPPSRTRLGQVLYQYEHDPSLRAAVLFGHGENFSRGIDVDASQAALIGGQTTPRPAGTLDHGDRARRAVRYLGHGDVAVAEHD